MIDPQQFVDALKAVALDFFVGVPDSLLKHFCACVNTQGAGQRHVIAANEGNAVGVAAGYHLATGRSAVVYLQNSGLGNAINPLVSIADKAVYRIPMLLVIGWRGEPGVPDEPQHVTQGRITINQLELLDFPYKIVDARSDVPALVQWVRRQLDDSRALAALLVRKDSFRAYDSGAGTGVMSPMRREQALSILLDLAGEAAIVATTGKTSREVYALRAANASPQRDFLTVGGMGHASSIALGVALGRPDQRVVCLDGDGALLMHMGALPIIGSVAPPRFIHVLLNNAAHESVGGQPTVADRIDFASIALASGYKAYAVASTLEAIPQAWRQLESQPGPVLLEVRIATGSRSDLGRPSTPPVANRDAFMQWLMR